MLSNVRSAKNLQTFQKRRFTSPGPRPPRTILEQDAAAREQAAREELGEGTRTARLENVFLFAAPKGSGQGFDQALGLVERALEAYFNGRFARRPERLVAVYLFASAAPYNAWCQARWNEACSSPYGFYLGTDRLIVMNAGPGLGTLTHELIHPIVESDFPGAPTWLNEGIASLYEQPIMPRRGEITGGKNWRHPRLARALGSKESEHASLARLFALTDEEFRGEREDLNYAVARYLCQWLDQRGALWPFYQRYRDNFAGDPRGEHAFQAVLGITPAEADPAWRRWVRAL